MLVLDRRIAHSHWWPPFVLVGMTLDQLLTRSATGDESAFAEFYDAAIDSVFGLARSVVRDPSMAEEIAHDVMLEVWAKAADFDPERGSAKAWVATITRRRAIDVVRSEQASRLRDQKVGSASITPASDPVAERVIDLDDHDRVRRGLDVLTDIQRQAIELAFYHGLTYRQVSEHLGVPLGTIKTRMRDALKRLGGIMGAGNA